MSRRRSHRGRKEPPELDITSFLNLMVVLVPFLLITAVFSRITILQLNLPTGVGEEQAQEKKITIEVIVRGDRIELSDGSQLVARFPNTEDGEYDIEALADTLYEIKRNYPGKRDATVLMEPDLEYQVLVRVMDAVTTVEVIEDDGTTSKIDLFPQISIGDAPGGGAAASAAAVPAGRPGGEATA